METQNKSSINLENGRRILKREKRNEVEEIRIKKEAKDQKERNEKVLGGKKSRGIV